MTDERMTLAELLQKSGDGDFLRTVAEAVLQILMEADVEGLIGAGRHERTGDRLNYRNGYRERSLDTRLGSLQLRIPKLHERHLRNALAHVPKPAHHGRRRDAASLPAGRCRGCVQTWRHVADQLRARWPKLATLIDDGEHHVLAYMTSPSEHRTKLHRTPTRSNHSTKRSSGGPAASFRTRRVSPP